VLAEASALPAFIVVNKIDLADPGSTFEPYRAAGYPVLFTSVKLRIGIDQLRDWLCGHWSALAGPSGAGKSSLLNTVQPGLDLAVRAVSQAVGKGRHTTVTARLVPLDCGGYVADTPGLRELGLWGIEPAELPAYLPEFTDLIGACPFSRSCRHTPARGCAIRDAVEARSTAR